MNKVFILLSIVAISCGNAVNRNTSDADFDKEKIDNYIQKDLLIGEFKKEELQQKPFSNWYEPGYDNYIPQEESMQIINEHISDYKIKVLMGTWCGDSKREIPKLMKILDKADFNFENLEMIAVDYNKTTPSKLEEELNVHRVPTIIFYKDGKEVNRFVEYSQEERFEEDIAKIVSGGLYKNSYAN